MAKVAHLEVRPGCLQCRIILLRIKLRVVARRQRPEYIARNLQKENSPHVTHPAICMLQINSLFLSWLLEPRHTVEF